MTRATSPHPGRTILGQTAHTWTQRLKLLASSALFLGALFLALPPGLGGKFAWTVVSGRSMEPDYNTLDLILTVNTGTPKIGDVIVYRVPAAEPGEGKQVVHRIIGGTPSAGYITQGDNREGPDQWHPRRRDVVGRMIVLVPQGGRVILVLLNMHNLGIVAFVLIVWALWPRRDAATSDAESVAGQAVSPAI